VRLFVALAIPSAVRIQLAELIKTLSRVDPPSSKGKARWVRPENLHVTLKFIGYIEPAKSDAIRAALSAVHCSQPVDLIFRGLGFFPNENRPRVLWAGMEASPNLVALAGAVDRAVASQGIPLETRPFTPHLTLARFDPPGISKELRTAALAGMDREFGLLRTGEFHLIESKLKPSGAEYTTLQTFPFAAEAQTPNV
jgi:RNA 2',3'-cyclic 3'-phosphodiesterase